MKSVIKDVKIEEGEELKGRILNIHAKTGSFKTPTKAPTSTELNAKKNIGFDDPFLNPIFEITQRFSPGSISNFYKTNGYHSRKIGEINAHADTLINRNLVKYFPQFRKDTILNDDDMLSLVDVQLESNINVISLPELKEDASLIEFKNNLERYWKYCESEKPEAILMPYLNLSQDPDLFREKLNYLADYEGSLQAIGIKFASPNTYRPNLRALASFSDKEFWVHCSSIKRANWNSSIPSSQLHILQKFGVDTVSIEIPMAMGDGNNAKDKPILKTKYFNNDKITIPSIEESIHDGNLICNCPICRQRNFNELTEDLKRYQGNRSINAILNDFSKIHEVYAATSEFEISRQRIKEGDLNKYFKEKEGLKDYVSAEENQTSLNSFSN
ncbi:hypothetical protein [Methanobrevibacter sp.]